MPKIHLVQFPILVSLLVILLIIVPYIYATIESGEAYQFAGFLVNPIDGNSYLAKMYQGWEGNWRFYLPYTAQPGEGAYLFLFYLFLGHLSRITHIPLILVFHMARIVGSFVLLGSIWHYFNVFFQDCQVCRYSFSLAALGSGMGWILVPFGVFTADFWVSEAYPFLSAYSNPHFSFGLAVMLLMFASTKGNTPNFSIRKWIKMALMALALGIIAPFGIVVVLVVLNGIYVLQSFQNYLDDHTISINWLRRAVLGEIMPIVVGGVPILVYDFYVAHTDKVLSSWNAQNLTLSLPLWDTLISLSPVLPFSLISFGYIFIRNREVTAGTYKLVIWAAMGLILMYLPFSLQRRFMMGLYVPFVGLAVLGLKRAIGNYPDRFRRFIVMLFLLALPTNIVILLVAHHGIQTHDQMIYLRRDEVDALKWISNNTPSDGLILTSPEMGLFVPAHTGRRVIYGHPFETANAKMEKHAVTRFFRADLPQSEAKSFLIKRGIDYIFFGPRERELGILPNVNNIKPVFENETVVVLEVSD